MIDAPSFFFKIFRIFKSLKLTVFIIICLIIVFLIGVIVPQERLLGRSEYLSWKTRSPHIVETLEFFGLTDIYTSPLIIFLWTFFFLNLSVVMSSRIPVIWRKINTKVHPDEGTVKNGYVIEELSFEGLIHKLKERGYKIYIKNRSFFGVKNRYSPLLTPLFHLSFIMILSGALLSFYTSFRAYADVAVGETFQGDYRLIKRPLTGEIPSPVFTVISVRPVYYKGVVPTGLDVRILDEKGEKTVAINRPYKRDGIFFVIKKIDIAPLLILLDKKGRELDGFFIKLNILQGGMDSFEMGGYRFRTFFFADYGTDTDRGDINLPQILKETIREKRNQPLEVRNPALEISVLEGSRLINKKNIKIGEAIEFNGKRLLFADFVYWVRFYVVGEKGLILIYGGFVLLIVSLSLRFIFPRKEIFGLEMEGKIYTGGRVEFYGQSDIKRLFT